MSLITDPDLLSQGVEVVITTNDKKIQLVIAGNLSTDGVTLQCLYSFLKEEWKQDQALIKFPFPMQAITEEKFELINGWDFKDTTTKQLIRTGGWALKTDAGVSQEEYACIVSLGSIGGTDQVYYQQMSGGTATNIILTGVVNQAVKIFGDVSHGDYNFRGYFKIFVRTIAKSYASAALTDIGVTTMTYQTYRFPLSNSTDLKITHTDTQIIGQTPYFGALTASGLTAAVTGGTSGFTSVGSFVVGDVGKFICISSSATTNMGFYEIQQYINEDNVVVERNFNITQKGISFSVNPIGVNIKWYDTPQVRTIGGIPYNFHLIIEGNNATAEQIYEFTQYQLRQNNDIDYSGGTEMGVVTSDILRFVGDTLYTLVQNNSTEGVFIDNFQTTDTNRLTFADDTGANITFPYVASLTISFGENLTNDVSGKYWVFFTNDAAATVPQGKDYGTSGATLVQDNGSLVMTGSTYGVTTIVKTYDYDGNEQRGAGSKAKDAPITVVAIGLDSAQFVKATSTILRSTSNSVSLVAALERNYSNV